MFANSFQISAQWQRRGERAAMVAARVRRYLSLVKPSLPDDLKWWAYADLDGTSSFVVQPDDTRLEALLALSCDRMGPDDSPPYTGFSLTLFLTAEDPRTKPMVSAQIRLHAGVTEFQNHFTFESDVYYADKTDQRLVTYSALRANMMAAVWAFQPEFCQAGPFALQYYLDHAVYNRPFIGLSWMVWVQASLAQQVLPPAKY